jgi:hypothetical protein
MKVRVGECRARGLTLTTNTEGQDAVGEHETCLRQDEKYWFIVPGLIEATCCLRAICR